MRRLLSDPEWWISVVVAGIVVNLVSAYCKPLTDKVFRRSYQGVSDFASAKSRQFESEVAQIRGNPDSVLWSQLRLIELLIKLIAATAFSSYLRARSKVVTDQSLGVVLEIASLVAGMFAAGYMGTYWRGKTVLREAIKDMPPKHNTDGPPA
jgi:hypothetical protein